MLYGFGFDLRGSRLTCDATMVPFLELAEFVIIKIWRDFYDVRCWDPMSLRGQSIPQLVLDKKLDLFVTELTRDDNCPYRCKCTDQRSKRKILVNCTNQHLRKLPHVIPDGNNIELLLSGIDIHILKGKKYLNRTLSVDLSNNSFVSIDNDAPVLLRCYIITITHNRKVVQQYPRSLQVLSPCKINLGDYFVFHCNCDSFWIQDWINNHGLDICKPKSSIICSTERGYISISQLSEETLGCVVNNSVTMIMGASFVILCLMLMIMFFLVYFFHMNFSISIANFMKIKR